MSVGVELPKFEGWIRPGGTGGTLGLEATVEGEARNVGKNAYPEVGMTQMGTDLLQVEEWLL